MAINLDTSFLGILGLIFGLLLGYAGMKNVQSKSKSNVKTLASIAMFVVAVGGVGQFFGIWNLFGTPTGLTIGGDQGAITETEQGAVVIKTVGGQICKEQTDGTNSLDTRVREGILTTTLSYLSPSLSVFNTAGKEITTGTATAGTTGTYTTLNVAGCETGTIYALGSTTNVGGRIDYNSFNQLGQYEIVSTNSSRLDLQLLTDTYANDMNSTVTTVGNHQTSTSALAQQGTKCGKLQLRANFTVPGAFGSKDGGFVIAYDARDTTVFGNTDFSVSSSEISLTEIPCPADLVDAKAVDRCWKAPQLTSADGKKEVSYCIRASNGDPGVGTNATVIFSNVDYLKDTDGKVKLASYNDGNADQSTLDTALYFYFT